MTLCRSGGLLYLVFHQNSLTMSYVSQSETRMGHKLVIKNKKSCQFNLTNLYQEASGTGIFFYAVAVISSANGYISTNDIFLGDRIVPQNIRITNGEAAVNYATRKYNDPMTADPSVGVTKYLKMVNGELVEG